MTDVICPRCKRPATGWLLKRSDVCSPSYWANCIRQPETILAEQRESTLRCTQATLEALGIHGKCPKNGLDLVSIIMEAGYKLSVPSGVRPIGLKDFIETHPVGRFYLVSDEHAMALVDGVL